MTTDKSKTEMTVIYQESSNAVLGDRLDSVFDYIFTKAIQRKTINDKKKSLLSKTSIL